MCVSKPRRGIKRLVVPAKCKTLYIQRCLCNIKKINLGEQPKCLSLEWSHKHWCIHALEHRTGVEKDELGKGLQKGLEARSQNAGGRGVKRSVCLLFHIF